MVGHMWAPLSDHMLPLGPHDGATERHMRLAVPSVRTLKTQEGACGRLVAPAGACVKHKSAQVALSGAHWRPCVASGRQRASPWSGLVGSGSSPEPIKFVGLEHYFRDPVHG